MRRICAAFVVAAGLAAPLSGQEPPGRRLTVTVRVARFVQRGDTAEIGYAVRNAPQSQEQLWDFTVEAPATVLSVGVPQPERSWSTSRLTDVYPVVGWDMLGVHLAQGAESPELSYRALGVPAIVTYYAGGYFPPTRDTDDDPDAPLVAANPRDVLLREKVSGRTLGIVPVDPSAAPIQLVARLDSLALDACELGWIDNHGICNSLRVKINHAAREIAQGDGPHATNQLAALLHELDAQRGKHVDESAYWLLKVNAESILARL